MVNKIIHLFKASKEEKRAFFNSVFIMPFRGIRHIGKGSCIYKPLMLNGGAYIKLGDCVLIREHSRIEVLADWNGKKAKNTPRLEIGNNVNIEERLHLICAEEIIIEDNVTISFDVYITDNVHSYQEINVHALKQTLDTKKVLIKEYAMVGAGTRIMPGVTIGKNAIVGANAVVTKAVPDYSIVAGCPAKVIRQYDFEEKKWIQKDN